MWSLFADLVLFMIGMATASVGRWRTVRAGGAFRCRIRAIGTPPDAWPRLNGRWSRVRARWDGTRLIVRRSRLRRRTLVLPVLSCRDGTVGDRPRPPWRRGRQPLVIELDLADGSRVAAAATNARFRLAGPYLVAATRDLPWPPLPQGRPRRPAS